MPLTIPLITQTNKPNKRWLRSGEHSPLANVVLIVVSTAGILGLICLASVAWRNQDLDYNLTDAVGRRDVPQVRRLLEAGANPDAQWSGYDWRWKIRMMFTNSTERSSFHYTVMDRVKGDNEMESLLLKYR